MEVRKIDTKRDLWQFMQLPYQLHASTRHWIPPLWVTQKALFNPKNSFWIANEHAFFILVKDNQCVGRIAAFRNNALQATVGCFGFLECMDSVEAFRLLVRAAEKFLRQQGCQQMVGPLNPTIHHELGVLTAGFEYAPYFMTTHNPSYYPNCLQHCGLTQHKDFYAYQLGVEAYIQSEKSRRVADYLLQKHGLTLHTPNLRRFKDELKSFFTIYNDAFQQHWGFYPLPWSEFFALSKDLKSILDPDLILIVKKNRQPIAFLLALPNLNEVLPHIRNGRLFPFGLITLLRRKKSIRSLRVITIAVLQEYQHLGIGSLLYPEIARRARNKGYTQSELSWVVDDNGKMNQLIQSTGANCYKTYRLYSKSVTPLQPA